MVFESFAQGQSILLWSAFGIAVVLGAVANKTNFCTMGAVSDWVNIGDSGRMRAWLLAIAVAVLGVVVLESMNLLKIDDSFPPYRAGQLIWAENLLGGLLFGIGMTLASGCGNKTLIRIGTGNIKSIYVFAIVAVIAYFMINPFPGTDKTLFTELFYGWLRPLAVDLGKSQDLGTLVGGESAGQARIVIGSLLGLGLLIFIFRSQDFRKNFDNILGGVVVGLCVLAAWYVSSNIVINAGGETNSLRGFVQNWDFLAESSDGKPADSRPLAPQSFSFINPMGQALGYGLNTFSSAYLTFGVMAVLGVIVGSFLWALVSRGLRKEFFASGRDLWNHTLGAVLMGFGGVLAMGCTLGQAVTGISTLAVGSFIAFGGIVLGSALTMKVQYYRMLYPEEATFLKALVAGLADFKMLPASLRRLDAI